MRKLLRAICLFLVFFSIQTVYADVFTTDDNVSDKKNVFIVGNPDMYPLEYYDKSTGEFSGVIPDILKKISDNIKVDFTYIHSNTRNRFKLAESIEAEFVSTYTTKKSSEYDPDTITVMSYLSNGKILNIGWRYTKYADASLVERINKEIKKLSVEEINALILKYSVDAEEKAKYLFVINIFSIIFVVLSVVLLVVLIKRNTRRVKIGEITDAATGIGNLAYFENRFKDLSDELNYIAYIIVDGNYLQLYHEETTYMDAVKYIADTLSAHCIGDEFVARITENGLVFVFKSENETTARTYMDELMYQLLAYIDNDSVPYFRAVYYRIDNKDENCDLLLFNLRKICTTLFGTEMVYSVCSEQALYHDFEQKTYIEDIKKGLKNGEFSIYLQMVLDNKSNKVVSAEALSRWDRGDKGIVLPGKYIDVMEKNGIICDFDYYMFEKVCVQLHKWHETEFENVAISCNFTRITLSEGDFVERVKEILNKYIFDKNKIIIEITEDAIEKNRDIVVDNILACKRLGFKIALDDLGSGYTSLTNLCDYPIDIVKLDRSILLKTEYKNGRDLFSCIVSLVHNLGFKVVCEGVENDEHHQYVSGTECDYVQGWYYNKPAPVENAENYVKNNGVLLGGSK